jgi:triphosphoribosyl-dephospho-CoA synthase
MSQSHYEISDFVQIACVWEATARKLGNVHRYADFRNTTLNDFLLSAIAIRTPFADHCQRGIGWTIRKAVEATQQFVKQNTNLGICLLLAPLVSPHSTPTYREQIRSVLQHLTVEDARNVYAAIRSARPGGLGDSPEQDIANEPTVTLLEAMKLAADRDMVARQYANGFADVLDFGVPALLDAFAKFGCIEAAIIDCQLHWLASFPDSLIVRKNGFNVAVDVQNRVQKLLELGGLKSSRGCRAGNELDQYLRSDGNKLNPGTTADLVTATIFVALREGNLQPKDVFKWHNLDWLMVT